MYKPGDSLWNSKYPRPSAVYKATGLWDFGDDDRLKLPEEFLFAYPFALKVFAMRRSTRSTLRKQRRCPESTRS